MSLFTSREWWSVNLNENEMFDGQCLLVAIIGKDRYHSILLGNHNGLFRFYSPTSEITEDGVITGFKPTDLSLEVQLQAPILQLGMGALVSGSHDKYLAVLHPRLLSVFSFAKKDNVDDIGDQITMDLAYQHQLKHSAHSFVIGAFGGGRGRDFTCVQSLDGLLSFYEQESLSFKFYLPEFLLPSSFAYLQKIDAFLFLNSSLTLDCYSYEALASYRSTEDGSSKKISKLWSHAVGESILEISAVFNDVLNILILSERNLYNMNESGKIIFMKRLEYKPTCFHAYITAEAKKLMLLIATDSCFLNIYENTCLKWCMKIDQIPVCVDRIFLTNLYGGIVLLSENGFLQCVYIGTYPSIYLIPPVNEPELNVYEAEKELKKLQAEIQENEIETPITSEIINVNVTVDENVNLDENEIKTCGVSANLKTQSPINKVQILFVVNSPLKAKKPNEMISSLRDETTITTHVYLSKPGVVYSLDVKVVVTYVTNNGAPNVIEKSGVLPLNLVAGATVPTKEAKHKITLITNKPVCGMNQIFGDFSVDESITNVIGLKYLNSDASVTILAAKTSQRYRLQSDHMEAITLVLKELIVRLKKHFEKSTDFNLSYSSALPLQLYFEKIETYFDRLKKEKSLRDRLAKRTCQYRTIQKKVLINLKDATPKPVSNLYEILKDTYEMIVTTIEELQELEEELEFSRSRISALSELQLTLFELMAINRKDLDQLKVVFNPKMHDADDQGWLEVQGAAASFLLRTTLAKSMKDQQKATDVSLEPVTDVSKVFKHFLAIVDRVTKGTHLLERNEYESEKQVLKTMPGSQERDEINEEEVIPVGSKYVDIATIPNARENDGKKDNRLPKQEKADSGSGIRGNDQLGEFLDVRKEEAISVETQATIETRVPEEKRAEKESEPDENVMEDVIKKLEMAMEGRPTESIEDDAIWDLKMDEMRI